MTDQTTLVFPWLQGTWEQLTNYQQQNRLPSGVMLVGDKGLGLSLLAQSFAHSVFCLDTKENNAACGQCASCLLFQSGAYPDYFHVTPPEDKVTIPINTIRALSEGLALNSQYMKPRIAIIDSADLMLHAAANSLLKTLEEPSDNTSLILIAHDLAKVPMTIRSRCQLIHVNDIDLDKAITWLKGSGCEEAQAYLNLANNSPILALSLSKVGALNVRNNVFSELVSLLQGKSDPLAFAHLCVSLKELPVIDWVISILTDVVKCGHAAECIAVSNADLFSDLKVLADKLRLKDAHGMLDKLMALKRLQSGQVNQQLLFEEFAIHSYSLTNK